MTKKQFLNSCWVHYTTRLPEDAHSKKVIVWNYRVDMPWILESAAARKDFEKRIADPTWPPSGLANIALYYEWWMPTPDKPEER